MKHKERSLFLIKGDVSCEKIVGDSQSFVLCEDKGYLLKEVMPSSTIMVCSGDSVSPVRLLLEAVDFDKESPYKYIKPSTNAKMVGYPVEELKTKFLLGNKELSDVVQRLFLVRSGEVVHRLEYSFLLNISSYVRSLKLTNSNIELELMIYNEVIRGWARSNIEGSKEEVSVFFMLRCWENSNFSGWRKGLEDILLEEVKTAQVEEIVRASCIVSEAKAEILGELMK